MQCAYLRPLESPQEEEMATRTVDTDSVVLSKLPIWWILHISSCFAELVTFSAREESADLLPVWCRGLGDDLDGDVDLSRGRDRTTGLQTWDLSKILHRRIFRLKLLHHSFHLISTVLAIKNTNKWVKMGKSTPLAKILHCCRHGQIPPLALMIWRKKTSILWWCQSDYLRKRSMFCRSDDLKKEKK